METPLLRPPSCWVSLNTSISFFLRSPRLIGWSSLLFLVTVVLTWLGYSLAVDFTEGLISGLLGQEPQGGGIWGWIKVKGWLVTTWMFAVVSRVVAFYLAFLVAYICTTPGYIFLSASAEKKHEGADFEPDAALNVSGIIIDLWEGLKIGLFGIVVTAIALFANFIPMVGQVVVFLLYTYYSALLFVDYPASRRRWSLARKIRWVQGHHRISFRIGLLPAIASMIPLLNIFFMALLFPLMTIHTTLNFAAIEKCRAPSPPGPEETAPLRPAQP
ncbi:MAG: EI24 domain-containing protein [Thermodesulfobacteriota bacterium]